MARIRNFLTNHRESSSVANPVIREAPRRARTPQAGPQDIARVAYELYERRGRIDGHALEDWVEAERMVREQRAAMQPLTD